MEREQRKSLRAVITHECELNGFDPSCIDKVLLYSNYLLNEDVSFADTVLKSLVKAEELHKELVGA